MIHRPQVLMVRTFSVVLLCGILLSACSSAGLVIEDNLGARPLTNETDLNPSGFSNRQYEIGNPVTGDLP